MTARCCLCGDTDIHLYHLCRPCWRRAHRLLRKSEHDRRRAREEAELDYALHVLLANPPPAIRRLMAAIGTRHRVPAIPEGA